MAEEDIRQEELSTIAAIYPELQVDESNPHTFSIELPVSLSTPLTVLFPAATEGAPPIEPAQGQIPSIAAVDSHSLLNLPSLQVSIELPEGYPSEKPPQVGISTSPPWLSEPILRKLEKDVETLWEEIGRDQVIFTYIDNLQQSTDNIFGLVDSKGHLEVGPEHKIAILDYDIKAKRRAFEKETFDCGICLDPKKGTVCHQMLDCGHVFCVQCLQDFYNTAITEGDIASVICLQPNCAKEREDAVKGSSRKKKAKTFINPSELLQIPLERDIVKRYVMLKHKTELESDKNTVYCPRSWCQGAARSKKHKKPEGLEFVEASDEDSDAEGAASKKADGETVRDLLAICEDCGFAFCSRCEQSWHGEFTYCIPKDRKEEITEEEKASLDYLRLHTTPCPTCDAPCQKTHGCNHMRCFKCQTHFCYLCSAWLDPSNPYQHFNIQPSGKTNGCYMRLWELEGGDGDDVGIGYAGNAAGNDNVVPGQYGQHLEIVQQGLADDESDSDSDEADEEAEAVALAPRQQPQPRPGQRQPPRDQPNGRVAVAREGPLVLRIEGDAPPVQGGVVRRPQPGIPNPRGEANALQAGRQNGRGNRRGRANPGINRQHNRNRPQGQNQRVINNGRVRQNWMGDDVVLQADGQLNDRDAAWVRQFVQLALNDQEDLLDSDSDDE
ncbi:RWD-domain-containing protein [Hypoxylon trugodes]|uniref:RWD-domain-containing protein n=1 Tax=Hypoxylon trugodes TaxID=326681 RepID=UPI0021A12B74|nr:RWD-domain-containing protein [Hypoxylon trugodes]KAI1391035.1 RWD-domain-containing protein [Hypoxylon trugodes]